MKKIHVKNKIEKEADDSNSSIPSFKTDMGKRRVGAKMLFYFRIFTADRWHFSDMFLSVKNRGSE